MYSFCCDLGALNLLVVAACQLRRRAWVAPGLSAAIACHGDAVAMRVPELLDTAEVKSLPDLVACCLLPACLVAKGCRGRVVSLLPGLDPSARSTLRSHTLYIVFLLSDFSSFCGFFQAPKKRARKPAGALGKPAEGANRD
jgi:hypothetical protein